jgi:hypothetical protein
MIGSSPPPSRRYAERHEAQEQMGGAWLEQATSTL